MSQNEAAKTVISIDPIVLPTDPQSSSNAFLRLTGSNELVFIEIQGSIVRLDDTETKLGRLEHSDDGRIYLYVGYQKMEGKVVELKKPFAVLRKKPTNTTSLEVEMEVVDVCRKKIYFGMRPEPLNEMEC